MASINKSEIKMTMGQQPMSLTSHTKPSTIRLTTGYQHQREESIKSAGHKRPLTSMSESSNSIDDSRPAKRQLRESHHNIAQMIEITDEVKGMISSINENIIITKMDFICELELRSERSSSTSEGHKAVLSSINHELSEINKGLAYLNNFLLDNRGKQLSVGICFEEEFASMGQDIKSRSIQNTLKTFNRPSFAQDLNTLRGINDLKEKYNE
jgi:uncharacterized protein YkvS